MRHRRKVSDADAGTAAPITDQASPSTDPDAPRDDDGLAADDEETPECWICHDGPETEGLISPCSCKGTMKWVHRKCIKQWITRSEAPMASRLACPNCRSKYEFSFTSNGGEIWPDGSWLPNFKVLSTIDEVMAQDVTKRLMGCIISLLPCLLLLLGTGILLIEYQREVATHGPGELLPGSSIGYGDYTALLTYIFGDYFDTPPNALHGVRAAWSAVYLDFQQYAFYTTSSSLMITVLGGHDWVPWGERFGLSEPYARALLLNPPLMMQCRNVFVCFVLVILRPFPVLHAWGWWLCYVVLASWVQVRLPVLIFSSFLWKQSRCRLLYCDLLY
jgi:hypothetical protein